MAISERLALLVTLDANGAIKSFNDVGRAADKNLSKADTRLDKMASRFQKAGAGMLATAGLLGVGLYKAGQSAGELEQAVGGTEAVFGEASGVIDDFAKKAAQAAGLSESAFRTATTSIGGQLKGLGFTVEEAADQAVSLTQVAADLSATYGGTTAEAVSALGAAFRGEADPAERFNLFLNQTRVNAKAVELGLASSTSSVDAHAKAQATLALITDQSADAQGQFARETDTAQGSVARFRAETENLLAALGGAVAPVIADVASGVGGLAEKFNELAPEQQKSISKFAVLGVAAIGTAGALSYTIGTVTEMRDRFSGLTGKLKDGEGGLNNYGKAVAAIGFAGAIVAVASIASEFSKTTVEVDKLVDAFGDLDDANRQQLERFVSGLVAMQKFDGVIKDVAKSNLDAAQDMLDFAAANGLAADDVKRLQGVIDDQRVSHARNAISQSENRVAIDETVESLGGLATASDDAAPAVEGVTDKVDLQKEALDKASDSMKLFKEGIEDAFGDLTLEEAADRRAQAFSDMAQAFADAQENVKAAKQRVSDLLADPGVSEAKQRVADLLATPVGERSDTFARDLKAAQQAVVESGNQAARDLTAAQQAVQDAIDETSRSLEGNSEQALRNRETIRGAVDDIAAVIQAHRDEGDSLQDLQFIRELEKANLEDQLAQMGFNREEIGRYIEAIAKIPLTASTTVTFESAAAEERLKTWLARVTAAVTADPFGAEGVEFAKFSARQANNRAIGGPVTAGMGYRVNEYLGAGRGAEWFAPANGTITPAGSAAGANSYAFDVTINNAVPEPASDSISRLRGVSLQVASR